MGNASPLLPNLFLDALVSAPHDRHTSWSGRQNMSVVVCALEALNLPSETAGQAFGCEARNNGLHNEIGCAHDAAGQALGNEQPRTVRAHTWAIGTLLGVNRSHRRTRPLIRGWNARLRSKAHRKTKPLASTGRRKTKLLARLVLST